MFAIQLARGEVGGLIWPPEAQLDWSGWWGTKPKMSELSLAVASAGGGWIGSLRRPRPLASASRLMELAGPALARQE